jgi:hypothetical protein
LRSDPEKNDHVTLAVGSSGVGRIIAIKLLKDHQQRWSDGFVCIVCGSSR